MGDHDTAVNIVSNSEWRVVTFQHRVKKTASGDPRPTILGIEEGGKYREIKLETEQDELDWLLAQGKFSSVGYRTGDRVFTVLGGSGDAFCYALSRRGEEIGGKVYRIPGYKLKDLRELYLKGDRTPPEELFHDRDDASDAWLLTELARTAPTSFYPCGARDREQMLVAIKRRQHRETQQERIKAGNRLRARAIGQIFYSSEGKYPEGAIEDAVKRMEASDPILQGLIKEEAQRLKELERAYNHSWLKPLLSKITGVGPSIAGDIIAVVGDIRRFKTASQLKAYAGVHVLAVDGGKMPRGTDPKTAGGKFARRRAGQRANWNPQLRQALFQFGGQLIYRPDSEWGKKLLSVKATFREKHPYTELVVKKDEQGRAVESYPLREGEYKKKGNKYVISLPSGETIERMGTQRYYDGHIHRMAIWRTLSLFVEWLHAEWTRYDKEKRGMSSDEAKAA